MDTFFWSSGEHDNYAASYQFLYYKISGGAAGQIGRRAC